MRYGAKGVDVDVDFVKGHEAALAKNGQVLGLLASPLSAEKFEGSIGMIMVVIT
jgi:hypothetical protein